MYCRKRKKKDPKKMKEQKVEFKTEKKSEYLRGQKNYKKLETGVVSAYPRGCFDGPVSPTP
jgi:hypothetical protein